MTGARSGAAAVLKNRDFTRYVVSRFCANIATQMLIMAVGWQVYHLTGRVLDLGFVGLSQFLPFLCLVLLSGHVADQFDRRRILLACLSAYLACALVLLALAGTQTGSTLPIFGVLGLYGIARAFMLPAAQSFVPTLVPLEQLKAALAFNSSANQVAAITGPSLGGVLYALAQTRLGGTAGASGVYAACTLLLGVSAVLVGLIRTRRRPVRTQLTWASVSEGLRFIWGRPMILGAISLDLFAVLFGGATALLPAYTREVLHAGPAVFGLLRAAPGLGAGATALWLAFRPVSGRIGVKMFSGVAAFGLATIVMGLTHQFWVAMIALVVLGIGDMLSVFVRSLLVQLQTPDAIRGRVSAVNSVFIGASNELGEFESGTTAAAFGLVPAIVAGGALTLGVALLWARLFPGLWRMRDFEHREADD